MKKLRDEFREGLNNLIIKHLNIYPEDKKFTKEEVYEICCVVGYSIMNGTISAFVDAILGDKEEEQNEHINNIK